MTLLNCGVPVAIALAFACSAVRGQSADALADSEVKELATAMVKAYNAWDDKLNSSGAGLTLKETMRDQGRITYRLYVKGLPADHVYSLLQWPVTQKGPSVALQGVTFDKSGLAVCAGKPGTCGDPAKPDDPIDLQTAPVKGEPLRFAVVAEDAPQIRAVVKTVPVPNFGEDNRCRLDAVLLMPHAD